MGKIFNNFALFAIFVACLGLFALSAFMVEQRKKEISIRIVLGLPFRSIYKLSTWDFMKLILISTAIAIPIGWYLMNR
ncbi:ABC transporter permease [Eudoraea chungangensis]|uniref:ABC transporter permease n=1 Tax=Eudoraea chungangensis TaxID=1481905 RepID=UPI0023EDB18B|nr:FtsX-like permease family protein [Eudoraea chungangensis]